jgi:hypothetical protein
LGKTIVYQINKTIKHYFPDIREKLNQMEDARKRSDYELAELLTGGIAMFLFKSSSRNAFNLDRKEAQFQKNYFRLFKMRAPHMDAVDDLFRLLDEKELEKLKAIFVAGLIKQRVFHRFRFLGKRFLIAVDGTGIATFDYQHCPHCLIKTYESKTLYFHHVLEAKLITSNGLAISLATEWIENGQENYDKQDCEQKAFKRLAVKLKEYFPRLPICILADGLYPNKPFFDITLQNQWDFIVNFKDGNLPSVQEEISLLPGSQDIKLESFHPARDTSTTRKYKWANDIDYNKLTIHWIECTETVRNINDKTETTKKFVFITNIKINRDNAEQIVFNGRLRWKIENEGFNAQKNDNYLLEHKYSRASFNCMKNFYQCLQIAHMINQLVVLEEHIAKLFKEDGKLTIKHLWKRLGAFLLEGDLTVDEIKALDIGRIQIRLV